MTLQDRTSWTEPDDVDAAIDEIRATSHGLEHPADLDRLVERFGDRTYVLLGEASHGTSEYYRWRSRLTARLIQEKDFSFGAVEGDWTDCYEVNRYVKSLPESHETVRDALEAFERWPTWLWANWDALEFLDWQEVHNQTRAAGERVGFYGLDVYSLFESLEAVVDYLEDVDPDAAAEARAAYRCFEPYGDDAQEYTRAPAGTSWIGCQGYHLGAQHPRRRRQSDRHGGTRATQRRTARSRARGEVRRSTGRYGVTPG